MEDFIKGMDLSSLLEVEACGGKFYDQGVPGDAMAILKKYGANLFRFRVWNNPYTEDGKPYGAGANNLEKAVVLARRAKELGIGWLFNIHYSDFWTDPEKQTIPKEWKGQNAEELEQSVYRFTRHAMETFQKEKVLPDIVAVGNEITHGFLWPFGKTPHFDQITRFISAGIRAVKEVAPEAEIMIHLDNGGNNQLYRDWFDSYFKAGGVDFDIIGLSYYPFWHGTLDQLRENLNDISVRYHKDLIVTETSTAHTYDDYGKYEQLSSEQRRGMAAKFSMAGRVAYPGTPQGQADFMQALMEVIKQVPDGHGKGFVYWEPAWIPVPGSEWATQPGWEYVNEKGPGGNEWANQALFDYEGQALPALETIRRF